MKSLFGLLLLVTPVWAHSLHTEAVYTDGEIVLETYFSDGSTPGGAEVTVLHEGTEAFKGFTDPLGIFRYPTDQPGDYVLIVKDISLHRAQTSITVPPRNTPPTTSSLAAPHSQSTSDPAKTPDQPSKPPQSARPTGSTPWLRVVVGLLVVGVLGGALHAWQRIRSP